MSRLAGLTWIAEADDDRAVEAAGRLVAIADNGSRFVVVGVIDRGPDRDGTVLTSDDGATWAPVSDDSAFVGVDVADVTVGGPGFVAIGTTSGDPSVGATSDVAIVTSTDGLAWRRIPPDPVFADAYAGSITAYGDRLIVHGSSDAAGSVPVWTSADGFSWERADAGRSMAVVIVGPSGWLGGAADGNADDATAAMFRSTDGLAWARTDLPVETVTSGRARAVLDITIGPRGVVARGIASAGCGFGASCAAFPVAWWSSDGVDWGLLPHLEGPLGSSAASIAAMDGLGFIGVGGRAAWYSPDGWAWTTLDAPPSDGDVVDVVIRDDVLVAVGGRYTATGASLGWLGVARLHR